MKILVVRKMSALEYHYNGNHESKEIVESHNEQVENIGKIEKILNDANQEYRTVTRKELSEKLIEHYECIISAGGDGTVIATAAYNKNIPQLNLKTDKRSKGTLCQENIEKALDAVLNKNYTIEKWARQDVCLNGDFTGRALNETCVGEGLKFSKMARYELCNGKEKEIQKNSGFVIVTGTGSTGWPSAFESFPKDATSLRYKAIFPAEGAEFGEGKYFKIEYKGHEGKFALDTVEYDFPRDSVLEVKISKHPLQAIIPGENSR
jgi:NAD kinase